MKISFLKKENLKSFLIASIALSLLVVSIVIPKHEVEGDVSQDNTAGSWVGTIGPAAVGSPQSDVESHSASVAINFNSSLSQYEAGLNSTSTSGSIKSTVISPPLGTLKKWKQLKLGLRKPVGTNTTVSVDILCGDPAQPAGCPTLDNPIPGFTNIPLDVNDEYAIPTSLTATKIKIRVNFNRPDTTQQPIVLYNWQVSWEVNSGVNLTVSKTPNPANPELQSGFDAHPGVPNNHIVTYTLNYSLDRNVSNLTLELPYPAGSYTPVSGSTKNYQATYIGSSSGNPGGGKVVWNLGNKTAGTVGSVNASFKITSGPPDGTVFRTRAKVFGSDYPTVTLPDDTLNIQSKSFAYSRLIAPEYIAPNTDTSYILLLGAAFYWFQGDMFNPRYEFDYSTCFNNSFDPQIYGSGANVTVDKTNRKITFTLNSPFSLPLPNLEYVVVLRSAATCGTATVGGTLTFFSEQDSSFVKQKVTNATHNSTNPSNFDSAALPRFEIIKNGGPNPIGAGQRLDFHIRLNQRSTVPLTNFYIIDRIPANTTFISANMAPGVLFSKNVIPKNWKIYWHADTGGVQPARNAAGWVEMNNGPIPCPGDCTAPVPGNVKWVKVDVGVGNNFLWDRHANFDQPIVRISVVTNSSATGSVTNTVNAYAGNVCVGGCSTNFVVPIDNLPYFALTNVPFNTTNCSSGSFGSTTNPTVVSSGNPYCVTASVSNYQGFGFTSHGDARFVFVTVRLPDTQFLDTSTPFDPSPTQTYARCVMSGGQSSNCPDENGVIQSNPSWLYPHSTNCSAGPTCTITWRIRLMYSHYKYPQSFPWAYNFVIRTNTRPGLANDTTICNGNCTVAVTSSVPNNPNSLVSPYEVRISAITELRVNKAVSPTSISFGETTTSTITYRHEGASTGSAPNLFVMDALPEITSITPSARMIYVSQSAPVGHDVFFNTFYSRSGNPPPSNDPTWQPIASVGGQENIVNWVMWRRTTPYAITDPPVDLSLTLRDSGTPDGQQFINRAFVGFNNGGADNICSVCADASILIVNPGFATTSRGNVGSLRGFGFAVEPPTCSSISNNCNTNYLAISGQGVNIDRNFLNSFKDWLLDSYTFNVQETPPGKTVNYADMYKNYGGQAVNCDKESASTPGDESGCLNGNSRVKIFNVSSGNAFEINNTSNYSGPPRILFINDPSGGDALRINTDFTINDNSALIFVVNGHVRVAYGITNLHGVYLVDGQFATGRRIDEDNDDAGRFAAISIGQDGYARIAYLSGDNVRLIKCKDLDCANRDYGYVTTATDVTSINMELFASSPTVDLPKVVIGQRDASGKTTTKFINCLSEDCLTNTINNYEDAKDPDIIVNTTTGFPSYIFGTGSSAPRVTSFAHCLDANCPTPVVSPVDGAGVGNEDKGNEINYGIDTLSNPDRIVSTYVDRSAGRSDLWFSKFRWLGGGTGCSQSAFWDCRRITASPGNVGLYPGTMVHTGNGVAYNVFHNTQNNQIIFLSCRNADCTVPTQLVIDCNGNCLGRGYSSITSRTLALHTVYNTRREVTPGNWRNEVKYSFCNSSTVCHNNGAWASQFITGDLFPANAQIYTQSISLGRVIEANFPRIVFFNEDDRSLYYVRCTVINCDASNPANLVYKKIDDGTAVALKDKPLTVRGGVIAYGNNISGNKAISLQRDLFSTSTTEAGETFIFEPKYYYLLRDIIKEPEFIRESAP